MSSNRLPSGGYTSVPSVPSRTLFPYPSAPPSQLPSSNVTAAAAATSAAAGPVVGGGIVAATPAAAARLAAARQLVANPPFSGSGSTLSSAQMAAAHIAMQQRESQGEGARHIVRFPSHPPHLPTERR